MYACGFIEFCVSIYSTPGKLEASEKMLSLSAEVADQKRRSRMEKVMLGITPFSSLPGL